MVQLKHLWVGEKFHYDGMIYTKSNHGRSFYVKPSEVGGRPITVWRKIRKNRNVQPFENTRLK